MKEPYILVPPAVAKNVPIIQNTVENKIKLLLNADVLAATALACRRIEGYARIYYVIFFDRCMYT